MIAAFKALVNRWLFKNKNKAKFVASRLMPEEISEKVFFNGMEITRQHCIVCHAPFLMAMWVDSQHTIHEKGRVQVRKNENVQAEVTVTLNQKIEVPGNFILVYEITRAKCYQLPFWHQYILQKRYFLYKKKDTFLQGMIYAAMYSFPRQVIAVSYKDNDYFNIFPMDFQCLVESANVMLLGLRTTNTTLKKMLAARRVVISDTTSVDLKTIYDLGRNHSAAPPSLDQLSFGVIESERFQFYVPGFSAAYREFDIVKHVELGTHTMIVATAINSVRLRDDRACVHHTHFFEFVNSNYTELRP